MRVVAPAKINLHLRVGRVRADGFHPLLTWMCTVDLFDTLTLIRGPRESNRDHKSDATSPANAAESDDWFSLRTDHPTLPTDRGNLVVRVAAAMADTLGRDGEGSTGRRERVSAFLTKRIPAGAGLGGGSSDAAATIRALAAMEKLNWTAARMSEFAAQFGSDVPFFFHGPSSICTGRGEIVRPTPAPARATYAVLVLPGFEMPTPKVYAAFDELKLGSDDSLDAPPDFAAWAELKSEDLLPRLVNDLEAPAFKLQPALAELKAKLEQLEKNRIVRMSGSGSTLFTLFDDEATASEFARRVRLETNVGLQAVRLAPAVNMSAMSMSASAQV